VTQPHPTRTRLKFGGAAALNEKTKSALHPIPWPSTPGETGRRTPTKTRRPARARAPQLWFHGTQEDNIGTNQRHLKDPSDATNAHITTITYSSPPSN